MFASAKKNAHGSTSSRVEVTNHAASAARQQARRPTRAVFRSILWSGEPTPVPEPSAPTPTVDPNTPTRRAFAVIPWTGERAEAPTETQVSRCVRSILDTFAWE